ncbi:MULTISPECIES: type II toxin-antitoxin system HigB family toxin [Pseudomonas]|jgi:mRNA interferase HigB|uniref:type II toxin-antitoxin system HigB family toxin n=1 Tax=Pseudomonas TaxID=286 RepID=UPI000302AD0C|nr:MULTISPECIES: type II toxin-antitoxin system HigB family toxin [Pseudomonas]PNV99811.1 addiction module toxin RelE [Pseudomonas protegens]ROL79985.1 addiction module toxin RelE [Pseudomonas protegens]ROM23141.1 addiction module toxin RelE [Pseudomonas protegens]ROM42696.1 addiction module toxin RelE [Pseudomonas protegens]SCZ59289.1 mRNA interferase HigB [Pseudomonas sp. NFPP17]
MRIIAVSQLKAFWAKHPEAEQPLLAWVDEARKAEWSNPAQIKDQYRNASILKSRRVVFNIKGNEYRLIAVVAYRFGALHIKFVGTHQEYDAIDADSVDMEQPA